MYGHDYLDRIPTAAPCGTDWDDMTGDDRVRRCPTCSNSVFNLAGLGSAEARDLLEENEGRLCVRYYRRSDGTVLAGDCPRGVQRLQRMVAGIAAALLSALLATVVIAIV